MKLSRMPLLVWLYLVTVGLVFVTISPLTAAQIMLMLDRYLGAHFFDTQAGGSAVLWMHFFWIFGHPEVYILVLPAFAFANEIIPVFSRKAIFGYPAMVAASVGIGFISLSVWAHHMFTVGMGAGGEHLLRLCHDGDLRSHRHQDLQLAGDDVGRQDSLHRPDDVLHRVSVSVPDRGTYRHHARRSRRSTGSSATPTSSSRTSITCWSAQSCSALFAAFYYWYPKMTGRMMSEKLGKWHFWLFVIGFHLTFDFMHIPGLAGHAAPHLYLRGRPRLGDAGT